ncbi:ubiquinol-cytochrome c reductase iron-sulfur subunit [Thalassotalea atypica]|uniref:QcrA and Rieske domain-containing protein n=1 Tax=Thalassotalea atypica TaxID=2054316 RepID=UPI0025745945|nr:Rieske 2Fe-2S domain-containing protein [Thalassotalea atypica]
MKRRSFLKSVATITTVSLVGCKSTSAHYRPLHLNNRLVINKSHLANKSRFTVAFKDQIIAIIQHGADSYIALGMNCTHLGCEISPVEDGYICPCHGAKFDQVGVALKGPTNINLPRFKTDADDTNIYVEF